MLFWFVDLHCYLDLVNLQQWLGFKADSRLINEIMNVKLWMVF